VRAVTGAVAVRSRVGYGSAGFVRFREARVGLLLQAVDVDGPWRWRWLLTEEETGRPLADHRVDLDPATEQVAALGDLCRYASSHAAPDRRAADEARIVSEAGAWAGRELLGEQVGTAIVAAAPVTVRVAVPAAAEFVLCWPLELAHAGGRPLAARGDVTLVYDDEAVSLWNVREFILNASHTSALALRDWQQCLDLNAEILASAQQRGAGAYEIACHRFNDAWPLIGLGRLAEAGPLLRDCQQVFEDQRATDMLAAVLGARAGLEGKLGHRENAVDLARTGLRLGYARPGPRAIAVGHHNLALYLGKAGGDPAGQRAHRLAAALIRQLAGLADDLARTQRALAGELREDPGTEPLPATLAEVIKVAEQTDGVHLADLLTALQPDAQATEAALAQILRTADLPPQP
jgi:hypothetical protein